MSTRGSSPMILTGFFSAQQATTMAQVSARVTRRDAVAIAKDFEPKAESREPMGAEVAECAGGVGGDRERDGAHRPNTTRSSAYFPPPMMASASATIMSMNSNSHPGAFSSLNLRWALVLRN